MVEKLVLGNPIETWFSEYPVVEDIACLRETAWLNPDTLPSAEAIAACELTMDDVLDASARLDRFASFFMRAFPETTATQGIIESPLRAIPAMKRELEQREGMELPGTFMMKLDSHLAISGSIKARGGIYEVLKTAEDIALKEGLLTLEDDYARFCDEDVRAALSRYSVCVGSTGNLGLSIGIISACLGFKVTVHMSADARTWKKNMLRGKGVEVVEHGADYSVAVARGREEAKDDPFCHFVDDENSRTLFLGYSVAALRLKGQLEEEGIAVDAEHPMYVYLPCGVGGGPGGVAFGLKLVYGDAVRCFFAEPTHSCGMMLGMATGLDSGISVQDFGVDNKTAADGLAVGRPSGFVGGLMRPFMSGCYSLSDERMYALLAMLADSEGIRLEPSALAGMYGPVMLMRQDAFAPLRADDEVPAGMDRATHLVWATGGSMVPDEVMDDYYRKGCQELENLYA